MSRKAIGLHLRIAVFRRDQYRCKHCGTGGGRDNLEIDHIVPWSRLGSDDFENLQTLCRTCNRRKGARYSA